MIDNIKDKIVDAIRYARGQLGFQLVAEEWGSTEGKCACALGCLLVQNDSSIPEDPDVAAKKAAQLLGVSPDWINSFITGFDNGYESNDFSSVSAARKIGLELRQEFLSELDMVEEEEEIEFNDKEDDDDDDDDDSWMRITE